MTLSLTLFRSRAAGAPPRTLVAPPAPATRAGRLRWRWVTVAAIAGALWLAATAVGAQTLVSVARDSINMRAGAGTQHDVLWQLARGYPLQVVGRRGGWLKVRDFEGDTGWVLGRLTGRAPHTIVKVPRANLRSAAGTHARRVGQFTYGTVLQTLERRPGWVRVRAADGRTGWVARRLLWGW